MVIAWATSLNVGGRKGKTGYLRDAVIAHIEGDITAIGEVRGATGTHVGLGIEIFERGSDVVHTDRIFVVGVTGEYRCASLS